MPPYRRFYRPYRRTHYKRRRNRFYRRGIRAPFRRKQWRRKRKFKPRYKVKKFKFYKRKKKSIVLRQFQPTAINKCKCIGYKCLLQGSILRASNNFVQYIYSFVPEKQPGGGGWSIQILSLDSVFEDYQHLQCIWTKGNAGLPLVRYMGTKFTLYQSQETDYIFKWDNCWPMVDTIHTHADSAPFRMLQTKHKVVIPSLNTKKRRKPYKKVFVPPPAQMLNKWYFQKEICKTPLVMFTTTAVSLTFPFADPKAKSNNVTVLCINPYIFKNPDFQHYGTTGYSPKSTEDGKPLYLYGSNTPNVTYEKLRNNGNKPVITALVDTKNHTPGTPLNNSNSLSIDKVAGNPFHEEWTSGDQYIYFSLMTPTEMRNLIISHTEPSEPNKRSITNTGEIIYTFRYNPDKDDGSTNKQYIVSTASGNKIQPPQNENHILSGFPFPYMLWGWTDWIKKLGETPNFDTNKLVVLESKAFNDTTIPLFIPIDPQFVHGFDPYSDLTEQNHTISSYNAKNWFPRYEYQKYTINEICLSGPACPRPPWNHYLQALCKYTMYFKWGGCPKTLEKAYNPCSQSIWPTPDNQYGRPQVQNPNIFPQTELYSWDWQKDYVTEEAIARIKKYTDIDPTILSITGSKANPPPLQKTQKQNEDEEEEKKLQFQLHQLRFKKVILQLQLQQQLKSLKAK
nr:MAG: ORF1 [TTV-like mini virus]